MGKPGPLHALEALQELPFKLDDLWRLLLRHDAN
jgi:hypothetical protein